MKVLLVNAVLGRRQMPIFPLGLASLAAALDGHEVRVLDPADDLLRPTFYRTGRLGPLLLAVNLASRAAVELLKLLRRPV